MKVEETQVPRWLKAGSHPLRWVVWAYDKKNLTDHAERSNLNYDKIAFWDNRWWMGGQYSES